MSRRAFIWGLIFLGLIKYSMLEVKIKRTDLRPPKQNDVGLLFDVSVFNDPRKKQQTLDFHIRSENCCIYLDKPKKMCDAAKIVGGDFGQIIPNEVKLVTLIWPTVTLHNRDGYCEIIITSGTAKGEKFKLEHKILFDTTIGDTRHVSDILTSLVYGYNITKCETRDQNPLLGCVPENCEEKYFGYRNFFNTRKNICEPVPDCSSSKRKLVYDYTINECIDTDHVVCQEDIIRLKSGEFDNNTWIPEHSSEQVNQTIHHTSSKLNVPVEIPSEPIQFPWTGIMNISLMMGAATGIYLLASFLIFLLFFGMRKCFRRKKIQ